MANGMTRCLIAGLGLTLGTGAAFAQLQASNGFELGNLPTRDSGIVTPAGVDSDCCIEGGNGTPGCDDPDCEALICGQDSFCCDTSWDGICADAAQDQCAVCDGGPPPGDSDCCTPGGNGTPGCDDPDCEALICGQDSFCCDTSWDGICADAAIAQCAVCEGGGGGDSDCCTPGGNGTPGCDDPDCEALICGQDSFCCDTSWDGICADAAIAQCAICEGGGGNPVCGKGAGDCFIANGTPGCDDVECCEAICAADTFCCDTEWDGICADAALSSPACGFVPPVVECPKNGTAEGEDCGADTNGGCNSTPAAFDSVDCGDVICGTAWADGGTRDTDWFKLSVSESCDITVTLSAQFPQAFFKVGGIIGDVCGTPVVEIDGSATGVIATTLTPGDHYFFVAQSGFEGFPCDGGAVDYVVSFDCDCAQPTSCDGDLDGDGDTDSADLNILLGDFGCVAAQPSDCCTPGGNGTPGCDDPDCEALICGQDSFCCDTSWDGICADAAIAQCAVCGASGGVASCPGDLDGDGDTDSGDLNILLGDFGCVGDAPITGACCFSDGSCTDVEPADCVNAGGTFVGGDCKNAGCVAVCGPGAGDCCSANGTVGCDDADCCNLICAQDSFCCETSWDGICADAALQQCDVCSTPGACCFPDGSCQSVSAADCGAAGGTFVGGDCKNAGCAAVCGDGAGDCCTPGGNGTPGCDDADCCNLICAQDSFCCDTSWDGICADAAIAQCEVCDGDPPKGSDCCIPGGNGTPGCDDPDCEALICGQDSFCCDTSWDGICADAAIAQCAICEGGGGNPVCGKGAGDCFIANGTPGCDDVECCEAICAADTFCCDTEWDGICADAALSSPACGFVPPVVECPKNGVDEGEPCGDDTNGGCNSDPNAFTEVFCDDVICGTAWADGGTRDTDWFQLTVAENTTITATLDAQFPAAFFEVGGVCGGPVVITDGSATGEIVTVVAAGTHTFFVGQSGFEGFPCGGGAVDYVVSFSCEGGGTPASDCCSANGTPGCDDPDCEALICGQDSFCCDTSWDGICADAAVAQCAVCQ